jgi:prophage antirepressor-like protein
MSNFIFDDHPVRTSGSPDRPLFVAKDVCAALGIINYRDALEKLPEDERGGSQTDTLGGPQEMLAVTEAGLYRLIFRSDKPEAKRFQDWVFKEVLPQIRRSAQHKWLTKAFHQSKTGKVQAMILQELGIGTERAVRNEIALRGFSFNQPFDVGQFWAAVDQGFATKPRLNAFRLIQRKDNWLLYLLPNDALELAGEVADEWRNVSRRELRARLSSQTEWINGEYRQRFGWKAKASGQLCWALAVTKDSPEGLVKLIERLETLGRSLIPKTQWKLKGELLKESVPEPGNQIIND